MLSMDYTLNFINFKSIQVMGQVNRLYKVTWMSNYQGTSESFDMVH